MTKRQPFEEGWDAGLRGYTDPSVICPYDKMTKEWREWHAFYERAVALRAASDQTPKSTFAKINDLVRKIEGD